MTILIWPTNIPSESSSIFGSHGKVFHTSRGIVCFGGMAWKAGVNFHRTDSEIRAHRVDCTIGAWFPDLDGIGCVAIVNE